MVLFFTSTLLISALALVLLLCVKRWELNTGRVVGTAVRPSIGRFFCSVSLWVERIIPTLVRVYSKRLWYSSRSFIHKVTALVVVRIEHALEKTLHALRHTTDVRQGGGAASPFLREVSEHKRKLRIGGTFTKRHQE